MFRNFLFFCPLCMHSSEQIKMSPNLTKRYTKTNIVLGEGSYKTVTKAMDIEEGKEVAYNEVKLKKYEQELQTTSSFSKEIALLKNINHPNILKIISYWFEGDNFIFITELMTGGTLKEYIGKMGNLSEKLIKKWGKQILEGINYLHNCNPPIIHRDIKADNIFVNSAQGEIKIGDLGIAKEKKYKRYTIVGTLNYMAREMFEGDGYNEKVDIYAFGMTLIQMSTGRTPYVECQENSDIKKNVLQGIPPEALKYVENKCLKHLIINCITPAWDRYTAQKCLEHHFFKHTDCNGTCMPDACCMIYPVGKEKNISLSIINFRSIHDIITFQIQTIEQTTKENFKFIKFDYHLKKDSVKTICEELEKENVIQPNMLEYFQNLLQKGIEKAQDKLKKNEIRDGIFWLNKDENIDEELVIKSGNTDIKIPKKLNDINLKLDSQNDNDVRIKTLEIIQEIEDEIASLNNSVTEKSITGICKKPSFKSNIGDEEIQEAMLIYQNYIQNNSSESICEKRNNDIKSGSSLSQVYEITRKKYQKETKIEEFTQDACTITQRDDENGKQWASILIENDIVSTKDLKILTYEDWKKLNITLFGSRIMQNMLYGYNNYPKKNRDLCVIDHVEYPNTMSIYEFVKLVCEKMQKEEQIKTWTRAFSNQDIRIVGELKGLTEEDWSQLELSVLGYRILYNAFHQKG
ncbi:serine/threonine protein kinase [Enterocytozoon bieneusi H348]|nr:serine/threonine protein kinase [Enterocytozoon bieneusi H348]|eukprot:XP_002650332.1 serine/threonine protein kinase [Enterocytozoon bieneusi H348]